jgi:hypothetical protein
VIVLIGVFDIEDDLNEWVERFLLLAIEILLHIKPQLVRLPLEASLS